MDGFGVFRRASATITSPTEGANFPDAPATIRISATAQVPAGALKTFGTISIRRRFTNNTRSGLTRLRFRIVDMTTLNTPAGGAPQADLRALTSGNVIVQVSGGGSVSVRSTTLDLTPAQTLGGGLHSTLSAGTVTLATPLAAGASINVQFLLGVERTGSFRFFINVEAAN